TNLGGLLASLSSFAEARAVLGRARTAASSAGAKLFEAQCDLIEAETWVLESPEWAQSLTARAKTAFETIGAARQAVEATVLEAEIVLERRDAPRAAEIVSRIVDEADKAGLGSRVALVLGRSRMLENDLDGARRSVDDALRLARAAADKPVEARALELHAELHDRMGTGAGDHHREEARLVVAHIAARIPTGLRERYLERRAVRIDPPKARALAGARLGQDGRRLLGLVARTLRERDEERVIETALDEAVSMTRAEHAFLLRKKENGRPTVEAARNFDRETIQNSRFRFSKSVAERVLASGEPVMAASAPTDPTLAQSRSVLDLGLLSILCVPIRGDGGIIGALYLDHRFEQGRFTDEDREVIQSLADVVGLALEQARLRGEAEARTDELRRAHESLRIESAQKDIELTRLLDALARGASATELDETKIVGRSLAVRSQIDIARRVAKTDLAVLIEGESGTGKELFARLVHDKSPRVRGPFLAINCGALPENLIESELFGHVRGAFTGATHDHVGLFRAAHGGTLFLDEVGELPLRVQTRLLRVLQERVLTALGSVVGQSIDVRIVAATNRDLDVEVEEGRFRRDLFFRLAGVRLRLPALRDRADDVLAVAAALLDRIGAEPGLRRVKLSRGAARALLDHHWPGNVRELEHALRRAVALSDGEELEAAHLSLDRGSSTVPRREARRSLDAEMVSKALAESGGNRTEAARSLGISRITMQRLVAKMGAAPAARGRPKRK
ncbi:MAG: sigma 54-interacting transcriptional regulator, partial [Polyangiaceae bacterium]|nr:sigma 54-interacting transcriptional regulator [Polyangiaceae bacterium]